MHCHPCGTTAQPVTTVSAATDATVSAAGTRRRPAGEHQRRSLATTLLLPGLVGTDRFNHKQLQAWWRCSRCMRCSTGFSDRHICATVLASRQRISCSASEGQRQRSQPENGRSARLTATAFQGALLDVACIKLLERLWICSTLCSSLAP
jgi:hypothetical protein